MCSIVPNESKETEAYTRKTHNAFNATGNVLVLSLRLNLLDYITGLACKFRPIYVTHRDEKRSV